MTELQRQAFEACAVLRAHTNLFAALIENGSLEQMEEQLKNLQSAFAAVVAIGEQQKKAA